MRLKQLKLSDLDILSAVNKERIESESLRLKKLRESQERLRKKAAKITQELCRADDLETGVQELRILLQDIPDNVLKLRSDFVEARQRSGSKDVTVKQAKEAVQKSQEIGAELKQACLHTLIVSQPEDPGSYSEDYSDSLPAQRRCLICGLQETGPKFVHLTEAKGRIIRYHRQAGNFQFFDSHVFP